MWNYLSKRSFQKVLLLVLVDASLVAFAIELGYVSKFSIRTWRLSIDAALARANLFFLVAVASHILFLHVYGLYSVVRPHAPLRLFLHVSFALIASTAMLMFLQFFVPKYWMGRVVLSAQLPLCAMLIYGWRVLFYRSRLARIHRKRLALIGSGPLIAGFLKDAWDGLSFQYELVGVLMSSAPSPSLSAESTCDRYERVNDLLADPRVEAVAFQLPDPALSRADIRALLHRSCQGVEVCDIVTLYKGMTGKVPLSYLDYGWLLSYMGIQGGPSPFYLKVKRVVDLSVGTIGLVLAFPLMIWIGILIRLDSEGPVLFRQDRLGQYRRNFQCLKFRTMVEQAEEGTGPVWSSPEDPRTTSVGKWLRRLRLDELPQLINVIRGDMSLIGPRPIRAHFADRLSQRIPLYELRFALRPGLTGWAQVNQGYANTENSQLEKFEYDLFYIQNVSIVIDCMILIKTFRTIFERKGH